MVRLTTPEDLVKDLTDQLISESDPKNRCPNFGIDSKGPYCARSLVPGEIISDQRRMICDNYSLQLWCLDRDRFNVCIWYRGEPFRSV